MGWILVNGLIKKEIKDAYHEIRPKNNRYWSITASYQWIYKK